MKVVELPGLDEKGDVSDWLARGTLTTVAGEPGIGKSTLLAAVATAVTTGTPLPGDTATRQPENVLLFASEDAEAEVVRPRYEDMGADLERIWVQAGIAVADGVIRPLSLPDDTQDLRDLLDKMQPALVILDPLVALETTGIDVHRQSTQRAILAPLQALATEYQCSIVCVVHLKKGATDNVNHRVAGSIDLVAAARTVWMVGEDPTEPGRRAVAVSKSNLGPRPAPRRFVLDGGRFLWIPEAASDLTAEDLFGPRPSEDDQARKSMLTEAKDWLRDFLEPGPQATLDCKEEAKKAGISEKTLERAKFELGVKSQRLGKAEGHKWMWYRPAREPLKGRDDHLDHLPERGAIQGLYQDGQDGHDLFFNGDGHLG